jgi:TIGR03009 family protein
MRIPSLLPVVVLAILGLLSSGVPAKAQAQAPSGTGNAAGVPRSQVRAPARPEPQPVAANTRGAAGRGQAEAADPQSMPAKVAPKAPAPPSQPPVPKGFALSESQQRLLDQVLLKWEKQSDKVKTFKCSFSRWEYDPTWGPKAHDFQTSKGEGEIKYAAPDRGEFQITELFEYDSKKVDYVRKTEGLDYWVCNGKAIFEFNSQKKQLIERRLPPELQGKAITDGPLPFIFGAKADQLKRRYWMRDATPKEEVGKTIWLDAVPKFQQDAANYQRATVVLTEADCMPFALRIFLPGGSSDTAYKFKNIKVNDILGKLDFTAPRLSATQVLMNWKHIVEKDPAEEQKAAPPAPEEPKQAKRPAPAAQRK